MKEIAKYLNKSLVSFFTANTRDHAIEQLVELAHKLEHIPDKENFVQAILEREEIVTTGIGMGVAIPHAKLDCFDTFFIAIGILNEGVDWNALDNAPVRLILMIGGPDDKQTEYLQILSGLTTALKDEERRKLLLKATEADEVIQLFEGF